MGEIIGRYGRNSEEKIQIEAQISHPKPSRNWKTGAAAVRQDLIRLLARNIVGIMSRRTARESSGVVEAKERGNKINWAWTWLWKVNVK